MVPAVVPWVSIPVAVVPPTGIVKGIVVLPVAKSVIGSM